MSKEKRRFKRYQLDYDFSIVIAGNTYEAIAQDYSVDGLNLFIKGDHNINTGEVIDLNIPKISLKTHGKVMRVTKQNGGLSLGVMRVGLLYGNLEDFTIADILLGIQRSVKTGLLYFKSGSINKTVHFHDGDIVFGSSNIAEDWLGEMLVREGKLTREQFIESSAKMKAENKLHGTVLVEMKLIQPKDLFEAVTRSVESIIISLFKIGKGDFMFKEGTLPEGDSLKLKLSAANLIYRGLRQLDDIELVRRMAPSGDDILCFSSDPLDLFQEINFLPEDTKLFKAVDGCKAYKELIAESGIDAFDAMRAFNALLGTRVVELNDDLFASKPKVKNKHWVEEVGGSIESDAKVKAEDVFESKPKEDQLSRDKFVRNIEWLFSEYLNIGYYGMLEVDRNATTSAIKKAYYNKARTYHPDKHFGLPDAMKQKLNTIFTYITQAYSTLTDPSRRDEYDKSGGTSHGDNTISDPTQRATSKFDEAMVLFNIKKYEMSTKVFGEATYLDPNNAKYHYYAALSMVGEGKHKDAERALQRATRIEPFNADYLAESGHIYLTLGFDLRAKTAFEKAVKITPLHARAMQGIQLLP